MQWNNWIRQIHSWLSITFTLFVIANLAVMGRGQIAGWIGLATLLPLALLLLNGLYLFVLPYARRRSVRVAEEQRSSSGQAVTVSVALTPTPIPCTG